MKVYQPEVVTFCWRNELLDAWKVARQLKIPFLFFNLEREYKKKIFDYMIEGYKKGETPNPDVFCNKFIKFGAFMEKALELGADRVAMGHYARSVYDENERKYFLKKGKDQNKDQSYFLSAISQEQLSKAIFPIGNLKKSEVRKIAKENNLLTAEKKDSQGLCFVGKVDMRSFLQNYLEKKEGDVLNENGEVIGRHQGAIFYTIGERHGFEIFPQFRTPNTPRRFVLSKDVKKNILVVGEKKEENIKKYLDRKEIKIKDLNWISGEPNFKKKYQAMIRYRGKSLPASLKKNDDKTVTVYFDEPQRSIAKGQILVIYDSEKCLGEGVICE